LECWTFGKEHIQRDCLENQGGRPHIYIAQEVQNARDVGQRIPCIYAVLDNRKENHQAFIIEMEGKLCDQVFSILIDPGSNSSYVNANLVDKCCLHKEVHEESWLVKFATGTKKRVHHWVRDYAFELNGMPTSTHLNVLPLGSYSMIFGMD